MNSDEPHDTSRLVMELCHEHHSRARTLFGGIGLSRGQPAILAALWEHDGLTHSELADLLRIQPPTVTKMAQRLEQAGYVTRRADPDDQRISRVYLTPAARAIEADVKRVRQTMSEDIVRGFAPDEVALLREFLIRMRDNLRRVNDA